MVDIAEISANAADNVGRDMLEDTIEVIKTMPAVWQKMTEEQQTAYIERLAWNISKSVRRSVYLIATHQLDDPVIRATVDSVTFKDGVKATLKMVKGQQSVDLAMHTGTDVIVLITDPEQYIQTMGEIEADPDQRDLLLEGEAHG